MPQLVLTVCLLASLTMISAQITPVNNAAFYPYGPGTADILDPSDDDSSSGAQSLSTPFPFFGNTYSSLYVNTNGDISFGGAVTGYTPIAFPVRNSRVIAVYFTDIKTGFSPRGGYIYHRETTDAGILARATTDIQTAFPADHGSFVATWVYIATWHEVAFYGSRSGTSRNLRNTFQLVLITDGQKSFALFNYHQIQFLQGSTNGGDSDTGTGPNPAQVGINGGNGIHYSLHPHSRTTNLYNLPTWTDPAVPGPPGRWYQKTDLATVGGIVDINACLSNLCHANATCTDHLPPSPGANCTCTVGYTGDGRVNGTGCSDINACSPNLCHAQATCTDNPAPALDATCTCNVGYTGDGRVNGTGCSDIDECAIGTDNCGANATCNNTAGSFTCSCNSGYSGNGVNCTDLNTCLSNPCHAQATCTDNPAPALDANCTCKVGYMGDGRVNGTGCLDINACSSNPCHANAMCTDNPAPALDANCSCNVGYEGDGRVSGTGCSDVNACSSNPCHANAMCTDNPAPALDATCTCNVGYTGDGRTNGTGCLDVNSCSSNPCHANATCTDNPAPALDANCTCTVGYAGDGRVNGTGCLDINACSSNPCHANATCTDNPAPALDANCTCNTGYAGDGTVNGTGCSVFRPLDLPIILTLACTCTLVVTLSIIKNVGMALSQMTPNNQQPPDTSHTNIYNLPNNQLPYQNNNFFQTPASFPTVPTTKII